MITNMREWILQSNAVKGFVWIMVLVLGGVFTIPTLFQKGSTEIQVAQINGVNIGYREFQRKSDFWRDQLFAFKRQYGKYADMFLQSMGLSEDPAVLALDALVKDELMNQEVARLRLYLSDQYVAEKLADSTFVQQWLSDVIPPHIIDQAGGGINESMLQTYLRQIQLPVTEFEAQVEQALKRHFFAELLMASVYVPAFEVRERYNVDVLSKKFSIMQFSFADYIAKEKARTVTSQELEDFYNERSRVTKHYWVPEKRVGVTWKFSPNDYGLSVSDHEVADYYDAHKTSKFVDRPAQVEVRTIVFAVPDRAQEAVVKQKAEQVRQELIEDQASFAQKAQEISTDKETASRGGLMPAFAKGVHEASFERAAFLLKADGDISAVVRTRKGFEIVQRVSKQPIVYKSLESARNSIVTAILKQKFSQQFAKDIEKLIQNPDDITSFIASRKAKAERHPALEKDGSKLATELFELKKDEYGLYVEGDFGVLAQLIDIQKKYLPTLDSIKELVMRDLNESQAIKAVARDLEQARALAPTVSFDELSASSGAHLETTKFIQLRDQKAIKALKDRGVPADQLFQIEKIGMLASAISSDHNGYLVRLDEVSPFTEEEFLAQESRLKADLERERKEAWGQGFVASLYRNATININEIRFKYQ